MHRDENICEVRGTAFPRSSRTKMTDQCLSHTYTHRHRTSNRCMDTDTRHTYGI